MNGMDPNGANREMVLPPGSYVFLMDATKGKINAYVGPYTKTLGKDDKLVCWDGTRYEEIWDIERAKHLFVRASEGQYVVLTDPSLKGADNHPPVGSLSDSIPELDVGRNVIIPGPITFPLWPGQTANVIDGHRLRNNQYILVRVVQPDEAKSNWNSAVLAPAGTNQDDDGNDKEQEPTAMKQLINQGFTMGQLIVIKGTDVSYYIPSTGLEVVPDARTGEFVREAVTLERLEYCVLLSESGEKRYMQGPAVVFPEPTENFKVENNSKIFRAIELSPQSGVYVKVIAPYEEGGQVYKEGDELFITGEQVPFYMPRPEHTIIKYGEQITHHAIAIPTGEGRYVLDRNTGEVRLVKGFAMFLPDPRNEVIVKRVLEPETVEVMYPGNRKALLVNEEYAHLYDGMISNNVELNSQYLRSDHKHAFGGDAIGRGTKNTKPRTIVLDTKYEGAISINVWPGYAVMVMDKSGNRRVEVGPKNIMLEYDESLMVIELSTGRPKTDDHTIKTVYLRTVNNLIGDRIKVETRDMMDIQLELSYRVNFEGQTQEEMARWFDTGNYVKLLTDNCRSKIRTAAKQHNIQEFIGDTEEIINEALLGDENDGVFDNGMEICGVEILAIQLSRDVHELLDRAAWTALDSFVKMTAAEEGSIRVKRLEELKRNDLEQMELTREAQVQADLKALLDGELLSEQKKKEDLENTRHATVIEDIKRASEKLDSDQELAIQAAAVDIEMESRKKIADMQLQLLGAIGPDMIQALQSFGDKNFITNLVEGLGPVAATTGIATIDLFKQIFQGTPFEKITEALAARPFADKIPHWDNDEDDED